MQSIIESPERAAGWRVVAHDPVADPATRQALAEAEEQVAALDRQMAGLIGNLGLLTGVAATMAAETINGLNAEIAAARARRDRLAADAARTAPARQAIVPTDALNAAIARAIDAMRAADPDPDGTHRITLDLGDAVKRVTLPTSWKARTGGTRGPRRDGDGDARTGGRAEVGGRDATAGGREARGMWSEGQAGP